MYILRKDCKSLPFRYSFVLSAWQQGRHTTNGIRKDNHVDIDAEKRKKRRIAAEEGEHNSIVNVSSTSEIVKL